MGKAWNADFANLPSDAPAAEARGVWFWIKQIVLFPCRMFGLFLILVVVPGIFAMWVLPDVAERYKVDIVLLVLRVLDEEGGGRPFRRLGYQKAIHAGLIELKSGESPLARRSSANGDEVVGVTASRTTEGEALVVRFASGRTQSIVPTTAHTIVPVQELAAARQAVSRLFPPADRKRWTEVLHWGESLFVSSWLQKYDLKVAPRELFPGPTVGTEDEQLWCVWQVLRSGGAPEEELFRLPELFLQTFPEKQDRETALAWANTLYENLGNYFPHRSLTVAARIPMLPALRPSPTASNAKFKLYVSRSERTFRSICSVVWCSMWAGGPSSGSSSNSVSRSASMSRRSASA